jgi:SAM-dependent methyltransferase
VPDALIAGKFDVVLLLRVLYHTRAPLLVLKRARWALRSGGLLYVESWFDDLREKAKRLDIYEDEPDGWRVAASLPALKSLLREAGFRQEPEVLYSYQGGHRQIWRVTA